MSLPTEIAATTRDELPCRGVDEPHHRCPSTRRDTREAISEAGARIPLDPLLTVEVEDSGVGLRGFVVIHSVGKDGAGGGIRCTPDITLEEVKTLARRMTAKYSYFGLSHGGGKGGLVLDEEAPPAQRKCAITKMGQHLAPILKCGAFSPGADIGFSVEDARTLLSAAGVPFDIPAADDSAQRTALSVFGAVLSAAESLRVPPRHCRVAIEGLGAVGGHLAAEIVAWGGRIVGVSNLCGAIAHPDGLPMDEVLGGRARFGPKFTLQPGPWRNSAREGLFDVEADVFVPAARVGSLSGPIARRLECQAVVPAANAPCTAEAEAIFVDRGVLLLPDFVVNCGGVLGMMRGEVGQTFFLGDFKRLIDRLISISRASGISPVELAWKTAADCFVARTGDFLERPAILERLVEAIRCRGWWPRNNRTLLARRQERVRRLVASYYHAAQP
jgi:glutamate dehydrogenase (NAD(P)+)